MTSKKVSATWKTGRPILKNLVANLMKRKLLIFADEMRYLQTNPRGTRISGEELRGSVVLTNTQEERTGILFADRAVELSVGFLSGNRPKASTSERLWRPNM